MTIAVIGAAGQLGMALQQMLGENAVPLDRSQLDITQADAVRSVLASLKPDIVINAAAYNHVDRAEDEPEKAFAVNALGPRNLARFCGENDTPLVHISTDYIFSGTIDYLGLHTPRRLPYREIDTPNPLNAYGVCKLAGESFVHGLCPRHFLVRTCGLYGPSQDGHSRNFVTTMLRLSETRDELRVVNDQRCTPTATSDLAEWIARLVTTEAYGLYHATNAGSTTWYDFAREIFRLAQRDVNVQPISSAEYGAQARRPAFSVLSCRKLQDTLDASLRPWQEAVAEYVPTFVGG